MVIGLENSEEPNPPAPFPKTEGGELSRVFLESSPPSRFGKGAGGLGSFLHQGCTQGPRYTLRNSAFAASSPGTVSFVPSQAMLRPSLSDIIPSTAAVVAR